MRKCPLCERTSSPLANDWDVYSQRKLGYGDDDSLKCCPCCRWEIVHMRKRWGTSTHIW